MDIKLAQHVPVKILIAEDNIINQKLAMNIFEGLGYKPTMVGNGLEVIEALRKENFDLIFMDVQMPNLDGLEATRRIRELPAHKNTPIIALTANAFAADRERCFAAGMNEVLVKPFDPEALYTMLLQWLSQG